MTTTDKLPTTGIGSLPHHNIDAALGFAFKTSLPFLPQIPMTNPWEFMIAQVLDGMPGIAADRDGSVQLDVNVWMGRSRGLNDRLAAAFGAQDKPDAFEAFEPTSSTSSCWQPFLWELEERGIKRAKVQLAGPLTAQWALRLSDGAGIVKYPEIGAQVYRLVLARALAMCRRLRAGGIEPVLYLDEPALYGLMTSDPRQAVGLRELAILIHALRKEGVIVGLHCCSNTDWDAVFGLGLDLISLDTGLSLEKALQRTVALHAFLARGGRFSLGAVPTASTDTNAVELDSKDLLARLLDAFGRGLSDEPGLAREILSKAILTPACGLALKSVADAELILDALLGLRAEALRILG